MVRTEASPDFCDSARATLRCERTQLKMLASEGLRVITMNVGTLTGRGREVSAFLHPHPDEDKEMQDYLCPGNQMEVERSAGID